MGNHHSAPQHTYSYLQIINNSFTDVTKTSVFGVSDFHWAGNCRPDRTFQDVAIPAKTSAERRFALKKQAPECPFTMTLTFRNGKIDTFYINQKYTVGGCANFKHSTQTHDLFYKRVNCKLVITIENTQNQIVNQRANERNQQGETALRQKKYDEAIQFFDKALGLAKEDSTISAVKKNKGNACNQLGKEVLQNAFDLEKEESEDKSEEAQSKFNQAKSLFQQAISLHNSSDYQKNLNVVNLKIDGNRLFNEGNQIDKEAYKLFDDDKGDNRRAQDKYEEALIKYEGAITKFEEGAKIDSRFNDSKTVVNTFTADVFFWEYLNRRLTFLGPIALIFVKSG